MNDLRGLRNGSLLKEVEILRTLNYQAISYLHDNCVLVPSELVSQLKSDSLRLTGITPVLVGCRYFTVLSYYPCIGK